MHRADLQAALQAHVNDHPDIELRLGCQFEDATPHAKGLTVVQRRGVTRQQEMALALVGADGIWSTVRHHVFAEVQPQFSGLIAWRGTLEATALPREHTSRRVQLWMGPNAHLVTYPISGARQINVVAVLPGTWNRPGWSAPGEITEIKNAFASAQWPATARMMVGAIDEWRKWALFTVPDGGKWTDGAIALLGDAAHAMLPFAAQGAGMAIEDAAVLAGCLGAVAGRRHAGTLGRPATLCTAAPGARAARSARRAAGGTDLSPHRPRRLCARPRDQGDRRKAAAGATGLDLWLATVNASAGLVQSTELPDRWGERAPFGCGAGAGGAAGVAVAAAGGKFVASVLAPGFVGELGLGSHRDVVVAIGQLGHHGTGNAGIGLRHQALQFG